MSMPVDLSGRVALVTGGGGGIGRGIALALARCGADVAVLDIQPEWAHATAEDVRSSGVRGLGIVGNVMETDEIRRAVAEAGAELGGLDVLVNNAGGVNGRRFLDQSERSWRRHIEINLVSVLAATSACTPFMIERGRGSIINVTSIESTRAAPNFAVYAACKAAVASFTRTMALELAEHEIRVNAIAPDWTRTPGNSGIRDGELPSELPRRPPATEAGLSRYIPLGREGTIDEIGAVAAFLASELASYVTGALVPVDGGTWASSGWTRSGPGWTLFGDVSASGDETG